MLTTDPGRRRSLGPARPRDSFLARRAGAIDRLVRAGMPRTIAQGWIAAWDDSTSELTDFRAAEDFWDLGYRYAVEEHRRGYRPRTRTSLAG